MKISVIGLGYVGLPLAGLLSMKFEVTGYDVDLDKIQDVLDGHEVVVEPGLSQLLKTSLGSKLLKLTVNIGDIKETDVKIITVGTPYSLETGETDFSQLDASLNMVIPHLKRGDVIMLKSTVPPGTTMGRVKEKIEMSGLNVPVDVGIVFSPERMVEGQAINDFKTLPKIIGATDENSFNIAKEILSTLGGSIVKVSSPTVAEMVKMVDNYSRFVFIGLTNEIALMSEKVGVDVMELIEAAKHDYPRNAGLLKPGPGVGGSCLNKDPFILQSHLNKQNLKLHFVEAAKTVNYGMASHVSDLVTRFSQSRRNLVIAGVAFKGDTNDTRFTTTFQIENELRVKGFSVNLTDPLVKRNDMQINPDLYSASSGRDIFLLLTNHSEYSKINLKKLREMMLENPIIIDTRAIIKKNEAESTGFEYHGLGRL